MLDLNSLSLPELFRQLTADGSLHRLVQAAIAEDLHDAGDITTQSIIDPQQQAEAHIAARGAGIIAGLTTLPAILNGTSVRYDLKRHDGDAVTAGDIVATLKGPLHEILGRERIILNIIGRLSGIATLTRRFADAVSNTRAKVCDTRKTTPGMRTLEKYAVRCGGGTLHRIGLFDAALYKDNHIAGIPLNELAARIREASTRVREKHQIRFIEVEVDSLEQLQQVLSIEAGIIDYVLLDNMTCKQLQQAVAMRDQVNASVRLEASGGVSLATIGDIAKTGVDRISVGALTHSAPSFDVGLDIH